MDETGGAGEIVRWRSAVGSSRPISAAKSWLRSFLLIALTAAAMPAPAADDDGGWTTWRSERFGFSICYPAEIFSKRRESKTGHGVSVESLESAQLIAAAVDYGGGTLAEPLRMERERLTHVSLIGRGENWFVVSGWRVDQVLYTKAIKVGDRLYAVRLRYPRSTAARYDPIVERVARCLKVPEDAY
ncbi:MAG: hypothetical protein ABW173_02255 [Sphingomonas sp.]